MLRRNHDLWKAGSVFSSILFFLVLAVWVSASTAHAQQSVLRPTAREASTLQATPTEDATVTALNKEKLAQEVQQLKNQNEPDFFGWLQANATLLSTLLVVMGGLIGLWRWSADRRDERVKRAEERFQSAVAGLGDNNEGAKIGAAILLRTFLRAGYKEFYIQTFDLAVANLRLPRTAGVPGNLSNELTSLPLTTLSQALIIVFKEAFPLARKQHRIWIVPDSNTPLPLTTRVMDFLVDSFVKGFSFIRKQRRRKHQSLDFRQLLDASGIVLDNAYLEGVDLREAYMPKASLRKASLTLADLYWANLGGADLSGADLTLADLRSANLSGANLSGARLVGAKFNEADLPEADLSGADLSGADLTDADFYKANLSGANLSGVKGVLASLNGVILDEVKGLTKEELEAWKAAVNSYSTANSPQSASASSLSVQDNDTQSQVVSLAHENAPSSEAGKSDAVSSQQDPTP